MRNESKTDFMFMFNPPCSTGDAVFHPLVMYGPNRNTGGMATIF